MLNRLESLSMGNSILELIESISFNTKTLLEETLSPSVNTPLDQLKACLQDLPEVDKEKVLLFKNQLQEGIYKIDSTEIARCMLNLDLA